MPPSFSLRLDPWTASSLLQKAIRRGEAELAQIAARALHRFRGNGIFRRLANIAVEDVGIADPALLWEVISLAAEKRLRDCIGDDAQLLKQLVAQLAAAPKCRSADHLICAATRLPQHQAEAQALSQVGFHKLIATAVAPEQPLTRRALSALLVCTGRADGSGTIQQRPLAALLELAGPECSEPIRESIIGYARMGGHSFALMLIPLSSAFSGSTSRIVKRLVPACELIGGIPAYAFDKHTSAGKRAVANFARQNAAMRGVLSKWVPEALHARVAEMAAFYADAVPVSRKLHWEAGEALEALGREADMSFAGCPPAAMARIVECTQQNLEQLNSYRRAAVLGSDTRDYAPRS